MSAVRGASGAGCARCPAGSRCRASRRPRPARRPVRPDSDSVLACGGGRAPAPACRRRSARPALSAVDLRAEGLSSVAGDYTRTCLNCPSRCSSSRTCTASSRVGVSTMRLHGSSAPCRRARPAECRRPRSCPSPSSPARPRPGRAPIKRNALLLHGRRGLVADEVEGLGDFTADGDGAEGGGNVGGRGLGRSQGALAELPAASTPLGLSFVDASGVGYVVPMWARGRSLRRQCRYRRRKAGQSCRAGACDCLLRLSPPPSEESKEACAQPDREPGWPYRRSWSAMTISSLCNCFLLWGVTAGDWSTPTRPGTDARSTMPPSAHARTSNRIQ